MRDQHAQHGQAVEPVGEEGFPVRADGFVVDAAVDDGPAVLAVLAIAQQPQVDVVQRERQRHAQPVDAGRDLVADAACGQRVAQGIVELVFERVHGWGLFLILLSPLHCGLAALTLT